MPYAINCDKRIQVGLGKLNESYGISVSDQRRSDQIFDKARLVNCALMAKIHT